MYINWQPFQCLSWQNNFSHTTKVYIVLLCTTRYNCSECNSPISQVYTEPWRWTLNQILKRVFLTLPVHQEAEEGHCSIALLPSMETTWEPDVPLTVQLLHRLTLLSLHLHPRRRQVQKQPLGRGSIVEQEHLRVGGNKLISSAQKRVSYHKSI